MIGILIITHETVGEAYRGLAQHFFPGEPPKNIRILGVEHTEDHDDVIARAQTVIDEIDSGNGVLVLTDIFGATPCNAARKLVIEGKVAIITGINAPMMIKATQYCTQQTDLVAFTETVKTAAINGIFAITTPPEGVCAPC
ncbi:MAG: PTS mannose transporter subunit IIA [Neisseria sp.]|nr:PTS mannose transporter subunit IIA [Neisseria sp.]